jgi:hypothetical protein
MLVPVTKLAAADARKAMALATSSSCRNAQVHRADAIALDYA